MKRIKIPDVDDMWLVPLSSIRGPCYVVLNEDYTKNDYSENNYSAPTKDKNNVSAYVIEPKVKWGEAFLPQLVSQD